MTAATDPLSAATIEALDALAAEAVEAAGVPGLSLAVVRDRALAHVGCAGLADLERGIAVRPEHLFEIGSISKSFTALVVLALVDDGVLALEDPVTEHLPWFEVRSEFGPITLRHLLDHSSGLVMGPDTLPDEAAQVWSLRTTETGSAPGTIFHYSNVGFMTLGMVVGAVTGRPCTDLVRDRVLVPTGMVDSLTVITDGDRERMAVGYQPWHEDRPWRPGHRLAPATWFEVSAADGNVAATAGDMGRYLTMLLRRGVGDGGRLVSEGSFAAMSSPSSPGGEPSEHPSRYGLGINIETVDGSTALTHGGGMVGYSSFLAGDLDRGFGVVVLTNAPGDWLGAQWLARAAYDVVRDDVVAGAPVSVPPRFVAPPLPELPEGDDGSVDPRLSSFVGHYRSFTPWFTHLRVAATRGRLVLVAPNGVEAPGGVEELVELRPGHFRIGTDPRSPERLTMGPVVAGEALWVDHLDCRYSRTFRP